MEEGGGGGRGRERGGGGEGRGWVSVGGMEHSVRSHSMHAQA